MSNDVFQQVPPGYPFAPPKRPFSWATWTIVASTIAVFLYQLWRLHVTGFDVVGDQLSFSKQALVEHRYWTLLTYAWVHAVAIFGEPDLFWLHITANMIPLICLGPALEHMLGHLRFLGLYLGGALVSVLGWHLLNLDNLDPIMGASGAVFAVITGVGTALPRARVTVMLFFILPLRMSMRMVAIVICLAEGAQIIFKWMPEVAHSAHLTGGAFGFLFVGTLRLLRGKPYLSD